MTNSFEKFAPWLFVIGLFVVWEAACRLLNVPPIILPAPSVIFAAFQRFWGPIEIGRAHV